MFKRTAVYVRLGSLGRRRKTLPDIRQCSYQQCCLCASFLLQDQIPWGGGSSPYYVQIFPILYLMANSRKMGGAWLNRFLRCCFLLPFHSALFRNLSDPLEAILIQRLPHLMARKHNMKYFFFFVLNISLTSLDWLHFMRWKKSIPIHFLHTAFSYILIISPFFLS